MARNSAAFATARRIIVKPLEWTLIVAMAALTFDVLWGVFSRYALNAQSTWTEELAIYLLIWISLLGGALVYGEGGHLGVDYFTQKLDPAAARLAAIGVELVGLAFFASVLVYGGWVLVSETIASEQTSPSLGWLIGYVYAAAPIAGLFCCFFAIERLVALLVAKPEEPKSASLDPL